ncbi:L,D-transpeptidase [bacterium]|nr:L,D-transpeptidase [bacterium]
MKKFFVYGLLASTLSFLFANATFAQNYVTPEPDYCLNQYNESTNPYYDFEFLGSKRKLNFKKGEKAEVTIYIKNTGSLPMFSDESECTKFRPITRLGTARERDRSSILFGHLPGWQSPNRIRLDQKRLNPGEKGSFTFVAQMPQEEGIYREYFDVVLEGKQWINKDFAINFDIGEYTSENRDYLKYINTSKRVSKEDLNGEKLIEVTIATQKMRLKVGDIVIREFPVSTGTYSHPTPRGHTRIILKQQVRVAGKWPHYIMPKWLGFRAGGYGIHALPSLSFDNGYYWTEARNHIGTRKSHGCIRLLPKDAEFTYNFASVGTQVWVR